MSKILVIKENTLDEETRKALKASGQIVLEVKNINSVKILDGYAELSGNEILGCALQAIDWGMDKTARNKFGELVSAMFQSKAKTKTP